jgi:hypothetical protein
MDKEIQKQVALLSRIAAAKAGTGDVRPSDNSNTQFATMALWVGRRYGLPAQKVLLAVDRHFRDTQNSDGTWCYTNSGPIPTPAAMPDGVPYGAKGTATMTCAGLLGLAVGHGASLDIKKAKNPKLESTDISKDKAIKLGFQALGDAVGQPIGWSGSGKPAVDIPVVHGKGFYWLWSLERVAVAYDIETIGKKDWYQWGAELLINSQKGNGSWAGEYGDTGVDTCFALLFLKRVNLMRDLTSGLKGGRGLGMRALRSGGVGGSSLRGATPPKGSDTLSKGPSSSGADSETRPPEKPRRKPRTDEEAKAIRLSEDLEKASGERQMVLLKELRDTKGPEYTEALADVIGRLDADGRRKARAALADRLTRMKPATLRNYLKDEDVEIRRAAALAVAQKDALSLVPELIKLLSDPESLVERAAHAALKAMAGKDLGPPAGAERAERDRAIAAWKSWWEKKSRE